MVDAEGGRQLSSTDRARASELIRQLLGPSLPDNRTRAPLEELERILACPHVSDLLFYEDPPMTEEQVIERALQYRPFAM